MGPGSLSMVKLVCFDVFLFFNVFACFLGACFWGLLCLFCLFGWFVVFWGVFSGFVVLTLPMWLVCSVPCCVLCV